MRDNYLEADKQHIVILTSGLVGQADNQGSLQQNSFTGGIWHRLTSLSQSWPDFERLSCQIIRPTCCFFSLEFAFFRNLLPWQPSLVGISVRALWLGRVTGARGVTCFPSSHQSQSVPASSIMQVSNHPSWFSQTPRRRRPNVGFFLSLVSEGAGVAWEGNVAPSTYRSLLPVNGSPQNNGNYPNYVTKILGQNLWELFQKNSGSQLMSNNSSFM